MNCDFPMPLGPVITIRSCCQILNAPERNNICPVGERYWYVIKRHQYFGVAAAICQTDLAGAGFPHWPKRLFYCLRPPSELLRLLQ